jgi:hypothetical protein
MPERAGFCTTCLERTSPRSSGGTFTFNGIGLMLYGRKDPCATCASVVKTLWFCVLFIPLVPFGKYRVIELGRRRFLSRRLLGESVPPLPPASADLNVLRAGLQSPHAEWRAQCASLLGDRGVSAVAALPDLDRLAEDPDRKTRERSKWAAEAIRRASGST